MSSAIRQVHRRQIGIRSGSLYRHVPGRLNIPFASLVSASSDVASDIFLGFSASSCCHLLSYGWSLAPKLSFELRVWAVRPGLPLRLVLQVPLFGTLQSEPSERLEPGLFDIRAFRVRVFEPPDVGCLVLVGSFQQPASRLPSLHHYTIVAMPEEGLARDFRAALYSRNPPPGGDVACALSMQPVLSVCATPLHLSFLVHAPFPRPSVLGLCSVPAPFTKDPPARRLWYRLVVNCGDSLRTVTFSVRPVGLAAGGGTVEAEPQVVCVTTAPEAASTPHRNWWQRSTDVSACRMGGGFEEGGPRGGHMGGQPWLRAAPPEDQQQRRRQHRGTSPADADATPVLGAVELSFCSVIDVEALLRHCIRGRASNYDARLIALQDTPPPQMPPTEACAAETGTATLAEAAAPDASSLLLLVVVDVVLHESTLGVRVDNAGAGVDPPVSLHSVEGVKPAVRQYGRSTSAVYSKALPASAVLVKSSSQVSSTGLDAWASVLEDSEVGASRSNIASAKTGDDESASRKPCVRLPSELTVSCSSDSSNSDDEAGIIPSSLSSQAPSARISPPTQTCTPARELPLVLNAVPPVRTLLFAAVDLASGSVRVLRLCKCAPALQPAFDASRRRPGGLAGVTTGLVTDVRRAFFPALAGARQGLQLARELNNDTVLAGQSLHALVHPSYPLALIA